MKKNITGKTFSVVLAALLVTGSARPGLASWAAEASAGGIVSTEISAQEVSLKAVAASMVVSTAAEEDTVSGTAEEQSDEIVSGDETELNETENSGEESEKDISGTKADGDESLNVGSGTETNGYENLSEGSDAEMAREESLNGDSVAETDGNEDLNEGADAETAEDESLNSDSVTERAGTESLNEDSVAEAAETENLNEMPVTETADDECVNNAFETEPEAEGTGSSFTAAEAEDMGQPDMDGANSDIIQSDVNAERAVDEIAKEGPEATEAQPYEVEIDMSAAKGLKIVFPDVTLKSEGDWVEYSITVENTGDTTIILAEYQLPQTAEPLTVSGRMEKAEEEDFEADGELEPGDTCTFIFRIELSGDYEDGITVSGDLDYTIEYTAMVGMNVEIETAPAAKYEKHTAREVQ